MFNRIYFHLRPLVPTRLRVAIRSRVLSQPKIADHCAWPIDTSAGRTPLGWKGWPGGKQFAVILTHDVETAAGVANSPALAALEEKHGFRSAFNFVPEGSYTTPVALRQELVSRGFEIGVHDLRHDGKLYASRRAFSKNATRINRTLQEWGAKGFRSAFMLHQLDWLHELDIEYDASSFDVDPYEPQPDAATTIFPYWMPRPRQFGIAKDPSRNGFVELPYTLPQDSTLFAYLKQDNIAIWKTKVDWLAERGGMVLLNLHPDYVDFPTGQGERQCFPPEFYGELLAYIREKYSGAYWHALPKEVAAMITALPDEQRPRRPRHACMLTYSFFEQDNRVQRYARALASRGDVVDVLSLKPSQLPPRDPAQSIHAARIDETDPGIRVHHVQGRERNEKGVLDFVSKIGSFWWKASRLITKLHRLNKYDLIHVHNVPDFLVFAALLPKLRGARVLLDLHDLLPEFYQAKFKVETDSPIFRLMLLCERLSCQFADHVIVSNDLWCEKVAARSVSPDRCTAMVNHVDTRPFQDLVSRNPNQDAQSAPAVGQPKTLIFPGGLYHHQGLHVAVAAMAHLKGICPSLRLRIIGDGPERANLQKQITELGLSDSVSLEPPVPARQVPSLLTEADIGIVPKLAEGFGNEAYSTKIMEFMAAGIPVVASRTRIDEFYFGAGQVHFFRSADAEDLARAVMDLVNSTELRANLVAKGFAYLESNNWEVKSRDYLKLVDSLLPA